MWWMIAAQAAMGALSAADQYKKDKKAYEWNVKLQKYRNAMAFISDAQNQNAITTNTSLAIQTSALRAVSNQSEALRTRSTAIVNAAAAGVAGGSVAMAINDIDRQAATIEYNRREELQAQFLGFDQQRISSRMSAMMQQDYSYIPKPDKSSILMGALGGGMKGWAMSGGGGGQNTGDPGGGGNYGLSRTGTDTTGYGGAGFSYTGFGGPR